MSDFIFATTSGVISMSLCSSCACCVTFFIKSSSVSAVADHPQSEPASEQLILFVMVKNSLRSIYLIYQNGLWEQKEFSLNSIMKYLKWLNEWNLETKT